MELERLGYEILERRWRCRLGEIDLVARDGGTLVVVEVKTRNRARCFRAVDAVDWKKQKKLVRLALAYQASHRASTASRVIRFDVVGVTIPDTGPPAIELIRNAFDAQIF